MKRAALRFVCQFLIKSGHHHLTVALCVVTASCISGDERSWQKSDTGSSFLKPLALKTGEFEDCGEKAFKTGTDPNICGYNYQVIADSACPILGYVGKDSSCGWKRQPAESNWQRGRCDREWHEINSKQVDDGDNCESRKCPKITVYKCRFDGELNSCRHSNPANGSPVFQACEHPSHPIASVKSCENRAFGVIYKTCGIFLTSKELPMWLENRAILVDITIQNLVTHQANYYGAINDEHNFACLISKIDGDLIYADIIKSLKTRYFTIFAKDYDPNQFDCKAPSTTSSIREAICADGDSSLKCRTLRAYKMAASTLEITSGDLRNLSKDIPVIAPSGEEFRKKIESLSNLIQTMENK